MTRWQARLAQLNTSLAASGDDVGLYSERGDVHFFLGQFREAIADYDRMVALDPQLDASHWRRGIALFFAEDYDRAAGQFERYHSFDNVDRENGIWRYLCQVKGRNVETAQAGLLKYAKEDREPFPDLYRLFAAATTPEEITRRIESAELGDGEREKRRFYAELYIGLWHTVHDRPADARVHLGRAVSSRWPQTAGYGPHYMWQVGRLQRQELTSSRPEVLPPAVETPKASAPPL
jgi:lipoprotein NlpI